MTFNLRNGRSAKNSIWPHNYDIGFGYYYYLEREMLRSFGVSRQLYLTIFVDLDLDKYASKSFIG